MYQLFRPASDETKAWIRMSSFVSINPTSIAQGESIKKEQTCSPRSKPQRKQSKIT